MNTHKDHTATCLCCYNLYVSDGSPAYSEYTPGSPPAIDCDKVKMPWFDDDLTGLMKFLHEQGRECPFFVAKD